MIGYVCTLCGKDIDAVFPNDEKNGFVECYPDPSDRRNKLVRLTLKANEIKNKVDEKRRQYEEQMAKGFSQEEQKELIRLLKQVYSNIE